MSNIHYQNGLITALALQEENGYNTLIDAFPDYLTNGIFKALLNEANHPDWITSTTAPLLDLEYFGNHSGMKSVSKLLQRLPHNTTDGLVSASRTQLAKLILIKFSENWAHYEGIVDAEYTPTANVESEETFITETEYGKQTNNTGTQGMAHGEQISSTGTVVTDSELTEATTEDSVYGFNSSTPVDDKKQTASNDGTSTVTNNLNEGHSGTDTRTDNLQEKLSGSDKVTETRERVGNIGVTMTQQLLQAESDFWQKFHFLENIYKDIDSVLTLAVYDINNL